MSSALDLTLLLLAASVLGVVAFRSLNLPPMLGYLAVGILIGPHALGLVPDTGGTRYLAEFGVVFLMFSIGLEFSLPKLRAMRRIVLGLGLAQVLATIAAVMAAGYVAQRWFGMDVTLAGAFALGGALAMSSTAIVLKLLAERLELETEHGKRIVGVLLFQDLAVVPLLVIVPALATEAENVGLALGAARRHGTSRASASARRTGSAAGPRRPSPARARAPVQDARPAARARGSGSAGAPRRGPGTAARR